MPTKAVIRNEETGSIEKPDGQQNKKITLIANIYDEKWVEVSSDEFFDTIGLKKTTRKVKLKENPRQKLFCKCGGSIEFEFARKTIPVPEGYMDRFSDTDFEPIACPSCGVLYENISQVEFLSSHTTNEANIITIRTRVFENDKTIALCFFGTKIIVNHNTKKLIFKDIKYFISLNKSGQFFIIGYRNKGGKMVLRRTGLKFITQNFLTINVLPTLLIGKVRGKKTDPAEFDALLNGINEFCSLIMRFVNKDDIGRLTEMIDGRLEKEYKRYFASISFESPENIIAKKQVVYDFITNYKIPVLMAVIVYPPIATLFFTKGLDFTLGLLNSWIIPSTCLIKKDGQTSPVKILESIMKLKLLEDSKTQRSIVRKAEKLEKEKIQGTDLKKNASKKRKVSYIKTYDTRIPSDIVSNDERLKSIKLSRWIINELSDPNDLNLFLLSPTRQRFRKYSYHMVEKYGIKASAFFYERFYNRGDDYEEVGGEKGYKHIMKLLKKHFLQQSTNEYKYKFGSNSNHPDIYCYTDTIRMFLLLNRDLGQLFKMKSFDQVRTIHDDILKELNTIHDNNLNASVKDAMIKYKYFNCEINGISFEVIDSTSGLHTESSEMEHCVRSYSTSVSQGRSIIIKVCDCVDNSRATIGLAVRIDMEGLIEFSQLKSVRNVQATERIQRAVIHLMKKNNVGIPTHSSDLSFEKPKQTTLW